MDKRLINSIYKEHEGYGSGAGSTEEYEYLCPCGRGTILEEHDDIPGYRDHYVFINCNYCRKIFTLNTSQGTRKWKLDGFFIKGITLSKIRLDEGLEKYDISNSLVYLFEFLSWTFSIREKCIGKNESDLRFCALKDVLNLLKHDYDFIGLNFLITNRDLNISSEDSNQSVVFGDISVLGDVGKNRRERYRKELLSKSVKELTQEIFEDTLRVYNKHS